MIVCIAEKPSVARDIAHVLGASVKLDGYMEGNGYQVTWTFGHLCTLKEPHDYTTLWKSWTMEYLPMIPDRFGIKLIANQTYERQFHIIERLMQSADSIINCGDAGQEGELIQRWVMLKAKANCPVQRLWISSLTEEAIREGFNNLKPQSDYQALYEAGLCRAIGDWLLGMNATRLYTMKYRQGTRQVLSIGRVQTPTLALIVRRQLEIQNFVPQQYWVLSTVYRGTVFTAANRQDSGDEECETPQLSQSDYEQLLASIKGKEFEITSIAKKNGSEAPPRLFDLTSLQVECNKKHGFSAEDTLKHIQSLYEKKLTTYPRVDTTFLSDDIYPKCPQILSGLRPYASLIQPLLGSKLNKSKKVFDSSKVTDHHAIIPTGQDPSSTVLSRDEKLVYDLVARRFIAIFYPDCKFATTTVQGVVQTVDEWLFKANGKQILEEGWHVVFPSKKSNDDDENSDEEKTLPTFEKGEKGPHEPTLTEKWTNPPKPYTEATLLRAMETAGRMVENDELRDALKENGIGRPSTRANIITTLFKRNYIRKERKSLYATETGIDLIGVIREELLKSAELTGQWEKKLHDIAERKYDSKVFLEELKQMVSQIVYEVKVDNSNRRVSQAPTNDAKASKTVKKKSKEASNSDSPKPKPRRTKKAKEGDVCPKCGKGVVIKGKTAFGCSEWRNGCDFRQAFPKNKKTE